jgi:cytoskeleton protein RodZ
MTGQQTTILNGDGLTAGERLVKAREELGLTADDVAAELRLSPRQITALEQGDYSGLAGSTYVRGYLRNYARLVGLPVEAVIEPQTPAPAEPPDEEATGPAVDRQVSSADRSVKLVTYFIVAVIAGLALVWWQNRESPQISRLGGTSVARSGEATPLAGEPAPAAPARAGGAAEVSGDEAGTPGAASADAKAAAAESGAAPAADSAGTPLVASEENVSTAPEARPIPPGMARLVLDYGEDCWTDIRDARGKRLVHETILSGRTKVVDGVPPFEVFFGKAGGVRVAVNGTAYDFSTHIRREFARFTLAAEPAAR